MKIKTLILLILSILFSQSCTSTDADKMALTVIASSDQKTDPNGGVVSEKKHMVSVSHYREMDFIKDKAIFKIIIENNGREPVKISNENISVTFKGKGMGGKFKNIHIQSLPEFMKNLDYDFHNDEKKKINYLFRQAEMTAKKIEDTPPIAHAKESIAESFVQKFILTVNKIELKREQFKKLEEIMPDFLLKEQTILPGSIINAIMACNTSEIGPEEIGNFEVIIFLDGEMHRFTFERYLEED